MENFNKVSIPTVLAISFALSLAGPIAALAATDPGLGAAASFSILAQTAITGISTISGDVGMNNNGASISALLPVNVAGTIYSTDGGAPSTAIMAPAVQANASTAYTVTIPGLPIEGTPIALNELNGITRGPGVYDLPAGAVTLSGGVLTLDGPGTYIFRITTGLTSSGSINFINGARACDLFWDVGSLATINGASFAGTILSGTGVHFGPGVTLDGRALAVGGDVTLGVGGTISGPSCAPPPATFHVIKQVVNTNGGTATSSDFTVHVKLSGTDVTGSPATGTTTPGTLYSLSAGSYLVSEDASTTYAQSFSGDCNSSGSTTLLAGDVKTCTITNNDIAPAPTPVVAPPSGGGGNGPIVGSFGIISTGGSIGSIIPQTTPAAVPVPVPVPAPVPTPVPHAGQVLGASIGPTPTSSVPGFPNTGFSPEGEGTSWGTAILAGVLIFFVSMSSAVVRRWRKR